MIQLTFSRNIQKRFNKKKKDYIIIKNKKVGLWKIILCVYANKIEKANFYKKIKFIENQYLGFTFFAIGSINNFIYKSSKNVFK